MNFLLAKQKKIIKNVKLFLIGRHWLKGRSVCQWRCRCRQTRIRKSDVRGHGRQRCWRIHRRINGLRNLQRLFAFLHYVAVQRRRYRLRGRWTGRPSLVRELRAACLGLVERHAQELTPVGHASQGGLAKHRGHRQGHPVSGRRGRLRVLDKKKINIPFLTKKNYIFHPWCDNSYTKKKQSSLSKVCNSRPR